jgi:hypothetical protein
MLISRTPVRQRNGYARMALKKFVTNFTPHGVIFCIAEVKRRSGNFRGRPKMAYLVFIAKESSQPSGV